MAKMTDDQMLQQLELLEKQAIGYYTGEVAHEQAQALDYYNNKPFGTEEEGRSAVVSSDVWDVVEGLTPQILKPFVASADVVKFNPLGPDDEEAAQQESEYVNWVVTQRNESFAELVSWVKTGLLQKNGVVKYWWETTKQSSIERYYGVPDDLFAMIAQDTGVTVVEHSEMVDEATGELVHDVVLRTTEEQGFSKFCVIPPEEFLIGRDASTPSPKTSAFVQHRTMKTIGALRAMGYDVPDDIPSGMDMDPQYAAQYEARRSEEERMSADEGNDPSAREVLFKETYWLIDADGDGLPELRKLCTVGREIMANEETEEVPFAAWTPYPQPFKFYGRCPADEAKEIQLVKSTLWRQSLDNIYTINNNRTFANESVNIDDLIDNQIGGVVRVKGQGSVAQAVQAAQVTPIGAIVQPMIEYLDTAKENRTGFSRYNQGSADLGNNKTLGEVQIVSEQSNLRSEIVARCFANGLAELMRGIHGLCRRHATKAETIRLRGKWVNIDPRAWKKRTDMSISVGLGSSDTRTKLQGLQMLMMEQKQLAQLTQGALVKPANLYASASKMAETLGFKVSDEFFTGPQEQGPQVPPEVQAQMQHMQQQMQAMQQALQEAQSGIQAKMIDAQSRVQIEAMKAESAQMLEQLKADAAYNREELKAMSAMIQKLVQPPPQLAAAVAEDMNGQV